MKIARKIHALPPSSGQNPVLHHIPRRCRCNTPPHQHRQQRLSTLPGGCDRRHRLPVSAALHQDPVCPPSVSFPALQQIIPDREPAAPGRSNQMSPQTSRLLSRDLRLFMKKAYHAEAAKFVIFCRRLNLFVLSAQQSFFMIHKCVENAYSPVKSLASSTKKHYTDILTGIWILFSKF